MSSPTDDNTAAAASSSLVPASVPAAAAAAAAEYRMRPTSSALAAPATISPPSSPLARAAKLDEKESQDGTSQLSTSSPKSRLIRIDPIIFASLATPYAVVERPSQKTPKPPKKKQQQQEQQQQQQSRQRQRQRQHSAEAPSTSSSHSFLFGSFSYTSLTPSSGHTTSLQKDIQQHFSIFGHSHRRQHSHPSQLEQSPFSQQQQLRQPTAKPSASPGPTATTLAQSPHRRHPSTAQIASPYQQQHQNQQQHQCPPIPSSSSTSSSTSTLLTSPSASHSPRYHVDNSSNSTATTLPPLPFFSPLPFSSPLDLSQQLPQTDDNNHSFAIASRTQQQHQQGADPENTNADTIVNAITNKQQLSLTTSPLSPPPSSSTPHSNSDSPPQLLEMLTAHSGSGQNVGANAIPIPTRPGLFSSSDNGTVNNHSSNSNSSNTIRCILGSIGSGGFKSSSASSEVENQQRQRNSNSHATRSAQFLTPNATGEGSSVKSESSYLSSRRSSKDSNESMPGTSIEELVDQLIFSDYANSHDRVAKTKVFLLIYRRFMRPRGLLDMLIVRFNGLGDAIDDDKDTEANDTRLRICSCLYLWLKNYPNDIINRRTRQKVVTFLKERVALFPALYDMYIQLLPLSSTQYFNAWRWPTLHHYHHQLQLYNLQLYHPQHVRDHYQRPHPEQSSGGFSDQMSISSSHISPSVSSVSDDESDAGFPDSVSVYSEEDMDEDQEWGMVDDDEVPSAEAIVQSMTINDNPSRVDSRTDGDTSVSNNGTTTADGIAKTSSMNMDGLAAFAYLARGISGPPSSNVSLDSTALSGVGNNSIAGVIAVGRDRRSSTGSFAPIPSACAMETFVAGRRGSTSSVSSNPGPFTIVPQQHYYHHHLLGHHSAVATGSQDIGSDHRHSRHGLGLTHPFVQPSGPAPSIGKRSSSQAYRQQRRPSAPAMPTQQELSTTTPTTPLSASASPTPMMQPGLTSILGVAEAGSETGAHMSSQLTLALNASSTTLTAPIPHGTALSTPFPLAPPLETSKSETSKPMGAFSKAAASIFSKESSNGSNNNNNDGEGNVDNKIDPFNHHQQQLSMKAAAAAAGAGATSLTGPNAWLSSFYPGHMNPLSMTPVHIPLMEIKNLAIAEQLTCVEYGLFRKLKPRDMLRQVWKTKKGSTTFQACIAHFNFISSWVGTMILLPTKAKHRAKMMEKFISIAKILRDMGNFNTTMAIIAAMNTSSIHRLSQTRELIQGKDIWNTFKELEQLMSSERSFFEYRAALRASKLPCIPYMGVHLADLFSISEGNRDFRGPLQHQSLGGQGRVRGQDAAQLATTVGDAGGNGGQTLHWQKFVLMTDVISMVIAFQQEPCYRIKPDGFISRLITETYVWDDEELYTRSVGLEPGKPNHTRTLSKFAFFG